MTLDKLLEEFAPTYRDYNNRDTLKDVFQQCLRIKCKELLEIAAEKAEVKGTYTPTEFQGYFKKVGSVDKDSILNAVDLDNFISK